MSPPSSVECEAAAKAEASFVPALSQICLQDRSKGGTGPSLPSGPRWERSQQPDAELSKDPFTSMQHALALAEPLTTACSA